MGIGAPVRQHIAGERQRAASRLAGTHAYSAYLRAIATLRGRELKAGALVAMLPVLQRRQLRSADEMMSHDQVDRPLINYNKTWFYLSTIVTVFQRYDVRTCSSSRYMQQLQMPACCGLFPVRMVQ